jgi:hypothetical protein
MGPYVTYQDAIDHTYRYLGGGPSDVVLADIREAVNFAFREVYNAHTWTYYYKHGRLATTAPQSDGLVDYDASTGIVTLADASASAQASIACLASRTRRTSSWTP